MHAATSIFIFIASVQVDYDDHTFGLNTSESSFVLIDDSGWIPSTQNNYVIQNIGRSEIQAELWYGTQFNWIDIIEAATIRPGETKTLHDDDRPYYYTGLKLINNSPIRAVIHGEGGDLPSPFTPNIHIDLFQIIRNVLRFSVKYFIHFKPVVFIFKELTHMFWPEHKPNIWAEVSDKISQLLDERIKELIASLLENEINVYKYKIASLSDEINNKSQISEHYMNVAYDLIGLEEKFRFSSILSNHHNINLYILPMFSNVVSLKIHFYMLGVKYAEEIGLNNFAISKIRKYANATLENAFGHITDLSNYAVDNAYNTSEAQRIFDNMMAIRSHIAIHGEEYLPIWKYKMENPTSNSEIYNPVISYSSFHGKPTANLYAQATPVDVPQPLCPKMINGTRNKLKTIEIFFWCTDHTILKIGGAKLQFENGDEYVMGTITPITDSFELGDEKIIQITAYGDVKVDGLKFILSDGSIKNFGQTNSGFSTDFKLPDHHIPSFYLSSDSRDLEGQAANIAVSFQWHVKTN